MKVRLTLLAALALLPGCVSQGNFPSLAVRPAELEDWSEEPVREAPVVADDASLRTRIGALLGEARAGQRAFEDDILPAERAMGRAGAQGSDSWIEAQQAVSRVEAARARTGAALAELHDLGLQRADAATSAADLSALEQAIAEAEQISAGQQERMNRLSR